MLRRSAELGRRRGTVRGLELALELHFPGRAAAGGGPGQRARDRQARRDAGRRAAAVVRRLLRQAGGRDDAGGDRARIEHFKPVHTTYRLRVKAAKKPKDDRREDVPGVRAREPGRSRLLRVRRVPALGADAAHPGDHAADARPRAAEPAEPGPEPEPERRVEQAPPVPPPQPGERARPDHRTRRRCQPAAPGRRRVDHAAAARPGRDARRDAGRGRRARPARAGAGDGAQPERDRRQLRAARRRAARRLVVDLPRHRVPGPVRHGGHVRAGGRDPPAPAAHAGGARRGCGT